MYWVGDKEKALSLIRKARGIDINIRSNMIENVIESKNVYLDDQDKIKIIYENIPIKDLMDDKYNNCIIIYNEEIIDPEDPLNVSSKNDPVSYTHLTLPTIYSV